MWYNAGTITVAAGSVDVVGNGTAFVGNVDTSHALIAPDGRIYEIAQVVSATALKLVRPYAGGGAANVAYDILPTQVNLAGMTIRLDELLATFRVVRDTVGQGMFPDGTLAAPGMRFINDQDTGVSRAGPDVLSVVTGGVERVTVAANGNVGIGVTSPAERLTIAAAGPFFTSWRNSASGVVGATATSESDFRLYTASAHPLTFGTNGAERARIDVGGNLLVGVKTGAFHRINRLVPQGGVIAAFGAADVENIGFYHVAGSGYSAAAAALIMGQNTSTGRSINAGGTINASGADYAEYMVKAAGCGIIAKGDVCGVDRDGKLTKTWADAISFVIKSTDPSLVGGDTWDAEVGPKPEEPGTAPAEPSPPSLPAEEDDDAAIAAWRDAMAAYPAQVASYQAARAEWQKATDAYAKALPIWEAAHEKARQCVDRIAFCGQVPANVTGDFEVGDYIIAAASGAGIKAVAVKANDMTLAQYMRRIGKVWAIRDGRAWIDVQHG